MKALRHSQKGLVSIEFCLLGVAFLLFILVAIDMGRWMMTWGLLQESSHQAARIAAVSKPAENIQITVPGLSSASFELEWLDGNGEKELNENCAKFIRSSLGNDFEFKFFSPIGFFGLDEVLKYPDFQITVPTESLGYKKIPDACK